MPPLGRRSTLADRLELLRRELADRLEHPEAVPSQRRTRLLSTSDCSRSRSASRPSSAASSVQPPRKTRERGEQPLLLGVEQVVRPLDRRAQRLLARLGVAAARRRSSRLAEALEQLLASRGATCARRRARARAAGRRGARRARRRARRARSPARAARARATKSRRASRPREHRHRVDVLALRPAAARGSSRARRARGHSREQGRDARGAASIDVLEVVEQEQQPPVADELGQRAAASERARRSRRHDVCGSRSGASGTHQTPSG